MTTPTLYLKRTKDGRPDRLKLLCSYTHKDVAKQCGLGTARWQAESRAWTYPVDPTIVRVMLKVFGDELRIDPHLQDYLEEMYDRQMAITEATQDTSDLGNDLWDFQRGSVRFLSTAKKAVLGHQMGTGKTPISCSAIDYVDAARVIVVCPNSVKWSWVDHLMDWSTARDIYVVEADRRPIDDTRVTIIKGDRQTRDDELAKLCTDKEEFVVILNYDQLRIHQQVLCNYDYDVLIADEAHRLKNRKAQRTQSAVSVSTKCEYVWLLTGTPVRNNYDDFYTLLSICDPVRFTSYWNFVYIHLDTVPGFFQNVEIVGVRDLESFNAMLSSFMYRKTKKEVMDLPDKIQSVIKIPMTAPQEKNYTQMEKEFMVLLKQEIEEGKTYEHILRAPNVISQMMRLRQLCLTPALLGGTDKAGKMDTLYELLEDMRDQQGQVIIYSCFRQFLTYIEIILKNLEIKYDLIVGGQQSKDRDNVVRRLNSGDIQVVLGTIHSMGEGLNLQAASTAIFTDIDWVPAVNEQAEDRIHRGLIKESPTIIHLLHPNTIESDIRAACLRKDKIVGETAGQVEVLREMILRRG